MGGFDFPAWLALGIYGGLACSLVSLGSLAAYALGLRRGTPRQLARATLLCLSASALSLVAIGWKQVRFDLYGPLLDAREILAMLVWSAWLGWVLPLGAVVRYIARAQPLPPGQSFTLRVRAVATLAAIDDPARRNEPLGAGHPWGQLVPLRGELAERPILLTHQLSLLGREIDNDVVVDDERASRHHAEIHWDHGHPQLRDRGSLNGAVLNGQTVRSTAPLRDGDILEIGEQRYRFEMLAGAGGAAELGDAEATRKLRGSGGPAAAAAVLVLVGLDHGFELSRWELRQPVSLIGRDADCQVRLADPSVSRQHAQILRQPTGYFISDLQSSNSTAVNDVPLEGPVAVHSGDVVRVGAVTLRCEAYAPPVVDRSAPTTALEPSGSAPSPSSAPPAMSPVGTLTGMLQSISGQPSSKHPPAPRFGPPRLRPSRSAEPPDA